MCGGVRTPAGGSAAGRRRREVRGWPPGLCARGAPPDSDSPRPRGPGPGGHVLRRWGSDRLAPGWGRSGASGAQPGTGTWQGARRRPGRHGARGPSSPATCLGRGDPAPQLRTVRGGRVPRPHLLGLPCHYLSLPSVCGSVCHAPSVSVCLLPLIPYPVPSSHPRGLALPGQLSLCLPLRLPLPRTLVERLTLGSWALLPPGPGALRASVYLSLLRSVCPLRR